MFLYRDVLAIPMGPPQGIEPAKRSRHVPAVLSQGAVAQVHLLRGNRRLMAALLYGGGLRVGEVCTLRIKDIDLDRSLPSAFTEFAWQ